MEHIMGQAVIVHRCTEYKLTKNDTAL